MRKRERTARLRAGALFEECVLSALKIRGTGRLLIEMM
jgi:hypothetical protein